MIRVDEDNRIRIDNYLSTKLDISRSKIQKLIKSKNILVNNKSINSNYKIKLNDEITINYEDDSTDIEGEDIPIDIVYEDEYLLVINKKSGMVVHPAPGHYTGTLVNALIYKYNNIKGGEAFRPGIVHRLDKDTSGLMLVAKDERTHDALASQIKNREVEKHYLAITDGVIKNSSGTIDAPIGRDPNNRQKMKVIDGGKESITHFKVLERFSNNTLIECILETGRTHQIRTHMAYIGYPINNDPVYNNKKATAFGQMLHSYSIKFTHPITREKLSFTIDPPLEFIDKLNKLRNN